MDSCKIFGSQNLSVRRHFSLSSLYDASCWVFIFNNKRGELCSGWVTGRRCYVYLSTTEYLVRGYALLNCERPPRVVSFIASIVYMKDETVFMASLHHLSLAALLCRSVLIL